jgi:hypothetical protein
VLPQLALPIHAVILQVAQQMIRAVLREDNDYSSQRIRYYRRIISHNVPLRHHYPPSITAATPATTTATTAAKTNSSKAATATATSDTSGTSSSSSNSDDKRKPVARQAYGAKARARWLIVTDTRLFLLQASFFVIMSHIIIIKI